MKNSTSPREFTLLAFILGSILSVVLTASNTYLGLKAGLTISASIPAAVMSMLILKGIFNKGTIHENNIVQTLVSTGGSLASGVIFTMPSLVIMGIWEVFDYWMITWIAMLGGIMGAFLMVPLRKTLVIEHKQLVYPEGVATAEVLKVGDSGIKSGLWLIVGMAVGMVYKFFTGFIVIFKGSIMTGFKAFKTVFVFGAEASSALTAIGFIIGPRISSLVIVGAIVGWLIVLPIYILIYGVDISGDIIKIATSLLKPKIRFVGMGTMLVAGIWTIFEIRKNIKDALLFAFEGLFYRKKPLDTDVPREEKNIPFAILYGGVILVIIAVFSLFTYKTGSSAMGSISALAIIIAAFFFVAVSSYVVGLVGTSSNPTSGMILTSLIFTCLAFYIFKQTGPSGILAAICVGGTIGIAASVAGDMSQDLKSGYIIGATPFKQQLAQVVGCIVPAFIIVPILNLLHKAYTMGSNDLPAPQAYLMKMVVDGILGNGDLDFILIGVGMLIGIVIILLKLPAMPVAVGIYLPFATSCTIFIGGMINLLVQKLLLTFSGEEKIKSGIHKGILFSSGLIAGEALLGIAIAGTVVMGLKGFTIIDSILLTAISYIALLLLLVVVCVKSEKN